MHSRSRAIFTPPWPAGLDRLDQRITDALAVAAVPSLRIGMGIVFLWFGALKLFPGASPAEDLAARTGRLGSFLADGRAFTVAELERCNSRAKSALHVGAN